MRKTIQLILDTDSFALADRIREISKIRTDGMYCPRGSIIVGKKFIKVSRAVFVNFFTRLIIFGNIFSCAPGNLAFLEKMRRAANRSSK